MDDSWSDIPVVCAKCAYPLVADSGRCPECGMEFNRAVLIRKLYLEDSEPLWRNSPSGTTYRVFRLGWLCACALMSVLYVLPVICYPILSHWNWINVMIRANAKAVELWAYGAIAISFSMLIFGPATILIALYSRRKVRRYQEIVRRRIKGTR